MVKVKFKDLGIVGGDLRIVGACMLQCLDDVLALRCLNGIALLTVMAVMGL